MAQKNLSEMTKAELTDEARALGLGVSGGDSKAAILSMIEAALAQPAEKEPTTNPEMPSVKEAELEAAKAELTARADADKAEEALRLEAEGAALKQPDAGDPPALEPPPEGLAPEPRPYTAEMAAEVASATDDQLKDVLEHDNALRAKGDPDALPATWRAPIEAELKRRTEAAAMRSQIEEYEVVEGGRFFTPGYNTTLPKGSVISPFTHDLDEVRRQGIQLRPLTKHVTTAPDQLGVPRTRVEG